MKTLWVEKGPGRANYFIVVDTKPFSRSVGQALTRRGARRKARRILRDGIPQKEPYLIVESVTVR